MNNALKLEPVSGDLIPADAPPKSTPPEAAAGLAEQFSPGIYECRNGLLATIWEVTEDWIFGRVDNYPLVWFEDGLFLRGGGNEQDLTERISDLPLNPREELAKAALEDLLSYTRHKVDCGALYEHSRCECKCGVQDAREKGDKALAALTVEGGSDE